MPFENVLNQIARRMSGMKENSGAKKRKYFAQNSLERTFGCSSIEIMYLLCVQSEPITKPH